MAARWYRVGSGSAPCYCIFASEGLREHGATLALYFWHPGEARYMLAAPLLMALASWEYSRSLGTREQGSWSLCIFTSASSAVSPPISPALYLSVLSAPSVTSSFVSSWFPPPFRRLSLSVSHPRCDHSR